MFRYFGFLGYSVWERIIRNMRDVCEYCEFIETDWDRKMVLEKKIPRPSDLLSKLDYSGKTLLDK